MARIPSDCTFRSGSLSSLTPRKPSSPLKQSLCKVISLQCGSWMHFLRSPNQGGAGSNIYVYGEIIAGSNYYSNTLCTRVSTGVYQTDKIVWSSTSTEWQFTSTSCGNGWDAVESGSGHSVRSNLGGYDFMESYDNHTADFSSMSAYTKSEYSMLYWTGSQWDTPQWVKPYWTTSPYPPSNLGVDYGCTGSNEPWNIVGSSYGGLWSYSSEPSWACT
jgi:hypothetical protein